MLKEKQRTPLRYNSIISKRRNKVRAFSDKKLRGFVASESGLHDILEELFQKEGKGRKSETHSS